MICRLIRHATIVLDYKGQKLLVNPVLSPKGALNAISGHPDIVIANAGAARYLVGGRITMSACDILRIAKTLYDPPRRAAMVIACPMNS